MFIDMFNFLQSNAYFVQKNEAFMKKITDQCVQKRRLEASRVDSDWLF